METRFIKQIKHKKSVLFLFFAFLSLYCHSESDFGIWTEAGVEKKLAPGVLVDFAAEYRMRNNLEAIDRFSLGSGLSYRLYRNKEKTFSAKCGIDYKFIRSHILSSITLKKIVSGFQEYNEDDTYWISRHRASLSLSAGLSLARFKISLRERYQFTYNDGQYVKETKYRYSSIFYTLRPSGEEKEWKSAKLVNVLRSRLELDYDIPSFKMNPFVSVEFFNDIDNRLNLEKIRWRVGGEYSINKSHNFVVYYQFQNYSDQDEVAGHVVGAGYLFQF